MSRARPATLVLCEASDDVGPWIGRGLEALGFEVALVFAEELCVGAVWEHRLSVAGVPSFSVRLADGRSVSSTSIGALVNRLVRVPDLALGRAEPEDREYVEQEWRALLMSTIGGLARAGIPVVEPPDPFSLAGRWRSPLDWSLLAARAGLAVRPWTWSGEEALPQPLGPVNRGWTVIVVGTEVFPSDELDAATTDACRRLTALAGRVTLSVELVAEGDDRPTFADAATLPDLRAGGTASIEALAAVLAA